MDSFIAWMGGKKLLRKEICSKFPQYFNKYVEVFGGAAWVLFYNDKHAKIEVYNDLNSNLTNLFKCVKYHPNAIGEELELVLNSRDFFNDFKSLYNIEALTDIQRAARYLYMIKASYGAKVTTYGGKSRDITNTDFLKAVKDRLKHVIIENKSFENIIEQHDSEETLFYCDPPYFGAEQYYGFQFANEQHIMLNKYLNGIKGKAIVSYNDCDFVEQLYNDWNINKIQRSNNLSLNAGNKSYKELIITNY